MILDFYCDTLQTRLLAAQSLHRPTTFFSKMSVMKIFSTYLKLIMST